MQGHTILCVYIHTKHSEISPQQVKGGNISLYIADSPTVRLRPGGIKAWASPDNQIPDNQLPDNDETVDTKILYY